VKEKKGGTQHNNNHHKSKHSTLSMPIKNVIALKHSAKEKKCDNVTTVSKVVKNATISMLKHSITSKQHVALSFTTLSTTETHDT
jgi:hypothetical protein